MLNTIGDYPVYVHGQNVGSVTVSQDGLMTVFDCACSHRSRDILRLAAVCGGRYVPLGVVAPEAGVLRLKKRYSKNALASLGYCGTEAFHLIAPEEIYAVEEQLAPPAYETGYHDAAPPPAGTIPERSPYDTPQAAPDDTPAELYIPAELMTEQPVPYAGLPPGSEAIRYDNMPEPGAIQYNDWPEPDPEMVYAAPEPEPEIVYAAPEPEPEPAPEPAPAAPEPANKAAEYTAAAEAAMASEPAAEQAFSFNLDDLKAQLGPVMEMLSKSADTPAPPPETPETSIDDAWTWIRNPAVLFTDPSVAAACEGVTGALMSSHDGYEYLAVPVSPDEPFPLMPVFCFGSSGEIGGREYIIFKISNGNLTL